MVLGWFYGSLWLQVGFHGSRWVFMIFHGSWLVCHGSRWVFMVFHISRLFFHGSSWVGLIVFQLGFIWFFMVSGWFFMVPCCSYDFSWFHVGFSWFQVGFHGFSWFEVFFFSFFMLITPRNCVLALRSSLGLAGHRLALACYKILRHERCGGGDERGRSDGVAQRGRVDGSRGGKKRKKDRRRGWRESSSGVPVSQFTSVVSLYFYSPVKESLLT